MRSSQPTRLSARPNSAQPDLLPPASRRDLLRAAWRAHRHLHARYTLDQAMTEPGLRAALSGHARSLARRVGR